MKFNDVITGAAFVALGAAMLVIASGFAGFPGQKYGPSLFPSLIGAALALCGLLLMAQGLRARLRGEAWLVLDADLRDRRGGVAALMIVLTILAHIVIGDAVGFLPICIVSLLLLFLWLGLRPLTSVVTTVIATALIWWSFADLLRVPLPRGLLVGLI